MINTGKRKAILIFAADGYERVELAGPKKAFEAAGVDVKIASIAMGSIKSWDVNDWGDSVAVDMLMKVAHIDEFDALVLPGGVLNPDKTRTSRDVLAKINEFYDAGKPIAAICHAPWLLINAGLARGRTLTSWKSIRADLENAGAIFVDQEVAMDGNLITSRQPEDVPAFSRAVLRAIGA